MDRLTNPSDPEGAPYETTTTLGYKALWLDFEEDTSKGGIDAVLHGPIAELSFRW